VDQASILIISDDAEFCRAVTSRWQSERKVPGFTTASSDVALGFDPESFHLAIVGGLQPKALSVVLEAMEATGKRVLFITSDAQQMQLVRNRWPGTVVLRQHEHWLETLMLVAGEALQRAEATSRARRSESAKAVLERQATLGRYMLEMRHPLNNALTSILGNSELMLLEPGTHSASELAQIETIRNMALRVHEILQRFSSLEAELKVTEKQAETGLSTKSQGAATGA